MTDNVKAFTSHLTIVFLSFIFLIIFVITGPTLGRYTTNIISRLCLVVLHLGLYVYAGTLLDVKKDKKYDFLKGGIIAIIGIVIWYYTLTKTDINLVGIPKEVGEYWIPFNLYYTPFTTVFFLLNIPASPILSLLTNLLPSFLFGVGLRYKRSRIDREIQGKKLI